MPKVMRMLAKDSWLRRREMGYQSPLGQRDCLVRELYAHFNPCEVWRYQDDPSYCLKHTDHGAIFSLDFSTDGSLLLAGCERDTVLMFDPLSHKLLHTVSDAHSSAVNCVKFLDTRLFATCSDDSTVALWDSRNLKTRIRSFNGHTNWVKNVDYSARDGLLISSGFDGSIYTWDFNKYSETECTFNHVFNTNGLVRTRLNADASKMIISTKGGYLMIIHNLDLNSLTKDLAGFKPNMYRLMQLSQTPLPTIAKFRFLFSRHRKTNRVEFVSDFPAGDDAEVVSSLQVHPQGWCMVSRNVTYDEGSEWSCVHNIQDHDHDDTDTEDECNYDAVNEERSLGYQGACTNRPEFRPELEMSRAPQLSGIPASVIPTASNNMNVSPEDAILSAIHAIGSRRNHNRMPWMSHRRVTVETPARSHANEELHVSTRDMWRAMIANRDPNNRHLEQIRVQLIQTAIPLAAELPHMFSQAPIEDGAENPEGEENSDFEELGQGRLRFLAQRNREEHAHRSTSRYTIPILSREERLQENRREETASVYPSTSDRTTPVLSREEELQRNRREGTAYIRPSTSRHTITVLSREQVLQGNEREESAYAHLSTARYRMPVLSREERLQEENRIEETIRVRPSTSRYTMPVLNREERLAERQEGNSSFRVSHYVRNTSQQQSRQRVQIRPVGFSVQEDIPGISTQSTSSATASSTSARGPAFRLAVAPMSSFKPNPNCRIHQNVPRLTHYIQEPNVGKGFLKELCFSPDGRIICSPCGYGIRLLTFTPDCSELSTCIPTESPVMLHEFATHLACHRDYVISTKFSPKHCFLVSGCSNGTIIWHQPVV